MEVVGSQQHLHMQHMWLLMIEVNLTKNQSVFRAISFKAVLHYM